MNEITEVQQLMDPPPGLGPETMHAARSQLLHAALAPAGKRRRWILPVVAAVSAAVAAVGAVAAISVSPQPRSATLTAWTVHRAADDTVTVTVRQFRDPAGLQQSLSAAGVPALVQFSAGPCPAPSAAIPSNGATMGSVLARAVRAASGDVFVIHPNAIPVGTILELVFPGSGRAAVSASPVSLPVAIRLIPIPTVHLRCVEPAPNPLAS
jgi:hypothetical protein